MPRLSLILLVLWVDALVAHPVPMEILCAPPDTLRNGDPLTDPQSCEIYTKEWPADTPRPVASDPDWELLATLPYGSSTVQTAAVDHDTTLCTKARYQREEGVDNFSDDTPVACEAVCHGH